MPQGDLKLKAHAYNPGYSLEAGYNSAISKVFIDNPGVLGWGSDQKNKWQSMTPGAREHEFTAVLQKHVDGLMKEKDFLQAAMVIDFFGVKRDAKGKITDLDNQFFTDDAVKQFGFMTAKDVHAYSAEDRLIRQLTITAVDGNNGDIKPLRADDPYARKCKVLMPRSGGEFMSHAFGKTDFGMKTRDSLENLAQSITPQIQGAHHAPGM